jgi:hypothetical protein
MILTPKTEWAIIAAEEPNANAVFVGYAVPLIIASAAAAFIGYTFILNGDSSIEELRKTFDIDTDMLLKSREKISVRGFNETIALTWGLYYAFKAIVIGAIGLWLAAAILNAVSKNFGSQRNMGRSMQLVAYSMTPVFIGGLLMIYPPIGFIGSLFGLYGLYLLFLGLPQMMMTPQEKIVPYSGYSGFMLLTISVVIVYFYPMIFANIIAPVLGSIQINAHPLK